MSDIKQKAREILDNVQFLHGVPVSAPEEVKQSICELVDQAVQEERARCRKIFIDQAPWDKRGSDCVEAGFIFLITLFLLFI